MIQVTYTFDTEEELLAHIEARAKQIVAGAAPTAGETDKPARKSRKGATEPAAAAAAPVAAPVTTASPAVDMGSMLGLPTVSAAADPLNALLHGNSAGQLPPVAMPAPKPVEQPALTQQDVIKAFVQLAQTPPPKGGTDAAKRVLQQIDATLVTVTAIKPEQFATAIQLIRQALA